MLTRQRTLLTLTASQPQDSEWQATLMGLPLADSTASCCLGERQGSVLVPEMGASPCMTSSMTVGSCIQADK